MRRPATTRRCRPAFASWNCPVRDVDLLHNSNSQFLHVDWPARALANLGAPWLSTCHIAAASAGDAPGHCRGDMPSNWVVVSETLARAYGHGRCVPNGVDPDGLIFSSAKESYFLFSSRAEVADDKGLTLALVLSRSLGFPLTVMGASTSAEAMEERDRPLPELGCPLRGRRPGPNGRPSCLPAHGPCCSPPR